jgi:hypothetical protein
VTPFSLLLARLAVRIRPAVPSKAAALIARLEYFLPRLGPSPIRTTRDHRDRTLVPNAHSRCGRDTIRAAPNCHHCCDRSPHFLPLGAWRPGQRHRRPTPQQRIGTNLDAWGRPWPPPSRWSRDQHGCWSRGGFLGAGARSSRASTRPRIASPQQNKLLAESLRRSAPVLAIPPAISTAFG